MEEFYETQREVERWKMKLFQRASIFQRTSKQAQQKINAWIPNRVHEIMTESIKKMVEISLNGSDYFTKTPVLHGISISEREKRLNEALKKYKRMAVVEGASTGAGGLLLGAADFPLLLSIKMKFLFEACTIFGYSYHDKSERIFLLYVFQLAFSSENHRKEVFEKVELWSEVEEKGIDWRKFQQEYRDYLDFMKLLQLVPGVGAIVGAVVNKELLDQLGETVLNAYRLRWILENEIH